MKLHVVSPYSGTIHPDTNQEGRYRAGEEVDVPEAVAAFLLRCSPGSFATEKPKAKKVAAFDAETAALDELTAFAAAEGIDLDGISGEDDVRAAVLLALEERAKAKLESENAAGTTTNVRPQRKARAR